MMRDGRVAPLALLLPLPLLACILVVLLLLVPTEPTRCIGMAESAEHRDADNLDDALFVGRAHLSFSCMRVCRSSRYCREKNAKAESWNGSALLKYALSYSIVVLFCT
jgi:hypothetical protein